MLALNKFDLKEGVVAKGCLSDRKAPHNLWYCKVKTQNWFDEIRRRAAEFAEFRQILEENEREQA